MPYALSITVDGMQATKAKVDKRTTTPSATRRGATKRAEPPDGMTVNGRLRIAREALDISQAEAARRLGIAPQSLGDLENGDSAQPAADTLLNMRDRLGYNIDYIIRGKGMPLLSHFEDMAREAALIAIFRELKPELRDEAVRAVQGLRRAQGGSSATDPYPRDPPSDE